MAMPQVAQQSARGLPLDSHQGLYTLLSPSALRLPERVNIASR
jgi:hypothetical protein